MMKQDSTSLLENSSALAHAKTLLDAYSKGDICQALQELLSVSIDLDYLTLFVHDSGLTPHLVGCSGPDSNLPQRAMDSYKKGLFFFSDPNTHYYQNNLDDAQWPVMARLKAEDISNSEYRQRVYQDNRLIDRVSLLGQFNSHWYCLNAYRAEPAPLFNEHDLACLEGASAFISDSLALYFRLFPPAVWGDQSSQQNLVSKLESLNHGLTQRELEVCAKALLGQSNKIIARSLGLELSTVATYRRRAYEKLGIRSLNQLFGLLLS